MIRVPLLLMLLSLATAAEAYIGPGAGIGLLGSLWAWLVGILIVLSAILLWPLRWLIRRMRNKAAAASQTSAETGKNE